MIEFLILACYVLFPVVVNVAGEEALFARNALDVVFVFVALLLMMRRSSSLNRRREKNGLGFGLFLLLTYFLLQFLFALKDFDEMAVVAYLADLKPAAYLAILLLAISRGQRVRAGVYIGGGVFLAIFVISQLILSFIQGAGLTRPLGSGEVNYDAILLVLSLFATLNTIGKGEVNRVKYSWIAVVLIVALFASQSRTGMTALVVASLYYYRDSIRVQAVISAMFIVATLLIFALREEGAGSIAESDRMAMWVSAIEFISSRPFDMLLGFGPGASFDAIVPIELSELWGKQSEILREGNVYALQFHSMWIRLVLTIGLVGAGLMVGLLGQCWRKGDRTARSAIIVLGVFGISAGGVYLTNVALPILVACAWPAFDATRLRQRGEAGRSNYQPARRVWS